MKYNIATIRKIKQVTGVVFEINDYKVILHDAVDNDSVTISDYVYGVEIAESDTIESVIIKAEDNLIKLTANDYNDRMKKILADNNIEFPVNEA